MRGAADRRPAAGPNASDSEAGACSRGVADWWPDEEPVVDVYTCKDDIRKCSLFPMGESLMFDCAVALGMNCLLFRRLSFFLDPRLPRESLPLGRRARGRLAAALEICSNRHSQMLLGILHVSFNRRLRLQLVFSRGFGQENCHL